MHPRFLNLVMHDNIRSICSLYRMDLRHLFYETAEIAEANAKKNKPRALSKIESWNGLRKPSFSFKPSNFFTPLRESSILMVDTSGRATLLDIDFNSVLPMPSMIHGKGPNCVCFSIPDPRPFNNSLDSQCLFVLDMVPGSSTRSTFEVLKYIQSDRSQQLASSNSNENWFWSDRPVPPFVDDPAYRRSTKTCSSMVLGKSTICVSSMEEGVGTYSFDAVREEWSRDGSWVLPFCGNAEYVPELKRWFALSATSSSPHIHSLCALDLPASGFQSSLPPELQCAWDYLDLPEQSPPYKRHLLNMGSGRFCIVSFFKTLIPTGVDYIVDDESAVFTGVEVRRCNKNVEGPVRMINHMSKRYIFGTHRIHCVL